MNSTTSVASGVTAPATDRQHLVTVLLGLWMTAGLFLDGYFHQNLSGTEESFLTPWHGVFYSGFAASLFWLGRLSLGRAAGAPDAFLRHLPPGYGSARLGIVLFALGGAGDAAWHLVFGVEKGIDALLSPTHLLLFAGLVLILVVPARVVSQGAAAPAAWLQVGSVTAVTGLVGFFLNFVWGLGISDHVRVVYDPVSEIGETAVIAGVGSMLVTTLVLGAAARAVARIEPRPAGAHLVLIASVAGLVSGAFDEDAEGVIAAIVAGLVVEAGLRFGVAASTAIASATAALWLVYFGLLGALDGIEWQVEIWLGATVLCVLAAAVPGTRVLRTSVPRADRGRA